MIACPPSSKLSAAGLLCCGLLAFSACDKSDTPAKVTEPEQVQRQSTAPASAVLKPAEPSSFDEVAASLDKGGALYFYLSTEQWLAGLSEKVASLRDTVLPAMAGSAKSADQESAARAFGIVTDLVKKSGLEEVTGLGASSFALEPGLYRNKLFVHHYKGKGDGFLWSMAGGAPHPLTAHDFLPADTALASFMDLDIAKLMGVVRQTLEATGNPEIKKGLDTALIQFASATGMQLDEVLESLGGSLGTVVTLDAANPITVPLSGKEESIPTPRIAIFFKVKDARIFNRIDKVMAENPTVVRVDEADLKMRTLVMPVLPQLTLRVTAAEWNGHLVIASDDKLIRDLIAAQKTGNGFKSTPEFAKLTADLPGEGNGFQIVTQRFADLWNQFQAELIKKQASAAPEQTAMIQKLLAGQKVGPSYAVVSHLENGWLTVGKGNKGVSQLVGPLAVAPIAMMAGTMVPVVSKVQEKAKATKSLNQVKQIAIACKLYAVEHGGKFPPTLAALTPDYLTNPAILISPFAPEVPVGYTYTAGLTEKSDASAILIEDKFSGKEQQRIVGYVDGSVKILAAP